MLGMAQLVMFRKKIRSLEHYLVKARRDYKNHARRAYDPSMADILVPLSDEQLTDLACFLARCR